MQIPQRLPHFLGNVVVIRNVSLVFMCLCTCRHACQVVLIGERGRGGRGEGRGGEGRRREGEGEGRGGRGEGMERGGEGEGRGGRGGQFES